MRGRIVAAAAALLVGGAAAAPAGAQPEGPWRSQREAARAADDLAKDTQQLAWDLWGAGDLSRLAVAANALALKARHFHRRVRRPVPYRQLTDELSALRRDYRQLRAGFFRANRAGDVSHLTGDWLRLAQSYERLLLAMAVPARALDRPQQVSQAGEEVLQPPFPSSQPAGQLEPSAQFSGPVQSTSQAQD